MSLLKKILPLLLLAGTLPARAQKMKMILPVGHTAQVFAAVFSPEGSKILTSSEENAAKLWDAKTGMLLVNLKPPMNYLKLAEAHFSPDGKKIITLFQADKQESALIPVYDLVSVWDAGTGRRLFNLAIDHGHFRTANFSPDGRTIVSSLTDNSCKIWDAGSGDLLQALQEENRYTGKTFLARSAMSPDGQRVLTWSNDPFNRNVAVYTMPGGGPVFHISEPYANISGAAFSPDGAMLLTWSTDKTAKLWDGNTGRPLFTLTGQAGEIGSASFSPDGKKILTASATDARVFVWNAATGKVVHVLDLAARGAYCAAFSPDGQEILAGTDKDVQVWDAGSGKLLRALKGHSGSVLSTAWSSDGRKILTGAEDGTAKVWDAGTGRLLSDLAGSTLPFHFALFSPDGKDMLTLTDRADLKTWSCETGILERSFAFKKETDTADQLLSAAYSPDGRRLATASDRGIVTLFSNLTGREVSSFSAHSKSITALCFSPDGSRILTGSTDSTIKVWDAANFALAGVIKGSPGDVSCASYSHDGGMIVSGSKDGKARIWNARTFQMIRVLQWHSDGIRSARFSPDDRKIVTASGDRTAKVWEVATGVCLKELKEHVKGLTTASFSPDGQRIITAGEDDLCIVWDAEKGIRLKLLDGHSNSVVSAGYSPDGRKVLTASADHSCRVWEIGSSRLLYSFYLLKENGYILQTPSRYYLSTQDAAKSFHYVTEDLKILSFEQLDVRYNRPDKVLEEIGCRDTALINAYRQAYYKRIEKLGIKPSAFQEGLSIPEAEIRDRDKIEYGQKKEQIALHISGRDGAYELVRFNVWVNECPLFGQRGIDLTDKKTKTIDTTLIITLSYGENEIETSILNGNGVESYRMPLVVNYTPPREEEERVYFVGIGAQQFVQASNNLRYCAKDIRDLAVRLREKLGTRLQVDTLFNEDVSPEKIRKIRDSLLNSRENDKVIIAYSGHGLLTRDNNYFLSTYRMDFNAPEKGGLPYEELENLTDGIRSRKKLMMLDACNSGEVDKTSAGRARNATDTVSVTDASPAEVAKGIKRYPPARGKSSFELMQELFVNVSRGTGATVIAASTGDRPALEMEHLQNGVFTFSVLELMQAEKEATVNRLKKYVVNRVSELTEGRQKPTTRNEVKKTDWILW